MSKIGKKANTPTKAKTGADVEFEPLARQEKIVNGRRKIESPEAAAAFAEYIKLSAVPGEKRSLPRLAQKIGKSLSLLKRWSSEWDWLERARVMDDELSDAIVKGLQKRKMQVFQRQAVVADNLMAKAAAALEKLDKETLAPRDIAAFIDLAVKLQARLYGEPTEVVNVDKNMGALTIAELIAEDAAEAWREALEDDAE